jgi:hypothetical protein
VLDARDDLGQRESVGRKLEWTLALEVDPTQLSADVLTQIAFKVKRKVAGRIGDARGALPTASNRSGTS